MVIALQGTEMEKKSYGCNQQSRAQDSGPVQSVVYWALVLIAKKK